MKSILKIALVACLALPAAVLVGAQPQDQRELTLQTVKGRLKANGKFLDQARSKGKAGDAGGTQTAIENYSRGMDGLNKALSQGQFQGDEFQRVEALERVEKATSKHNDVLADLLNKVPEQARPAIERAMEASKRGHDTAASKLEGARTQRDAAVARRQDAERRTQMQNGTTGRPGSLPGAGGSGAAGGMSGGAPKAPGRPSGKPPGRP